MVRTKTNNRAQISQQVIPAKWRGLTSKCAPCNGGGRFGDFEQLYFEDQTPSFVSFNRYECPHCNGKGVIKKHVPILKTADLSNPVKDDSVLKKRKFCEEDLYEAAKRKAQIFSDAVHRYYEWATPLIGFPLMDKETLFCRYYINERFDGPAGTADLIDSQGMGILPAFRIRLNPDDTHTTSLALHPNGEMMYHNNLLELLRPQEPWNKELDEEDREEINNMYNDMLYNL